MTDTKSTNREALKRLREERSDQVASAQARLKVHLKLSGEITRLLKDGPRTVPSISEATGLPTQTVFWHLINLKKYGHVAEGDLNDEYYEYRLIGDES